MDAISDPQVHTVVVKSSAQVGKTEILLNSLGFYMDQDPSPILLIQPTLEMAEAFSKDRLAPMLRDTECLRFLVADPRSRDSGNTLLHKQFPGGHITMAGANSPSSLASRPVRIVLFDEVDRYPPSAGTEGDPVALGTARTKNFWNRKRILTSTPTIAGSSRIDEAYRESDGRRYFVACAHCQAEQVLEWEHVKWTDDNPETAAYYCPECGSGWTEAQRIKAVRGGKWIAERELTGVAGFHINELYSPWSRISDMAREFIEIKRVRSTERLRTFFNTSLGEVFEDDGEHPEEGSLLARKEKWDGMPEGVRVLTVGVDVQDNRLELELVGWGKDEESWSLDYKVIWGDPGQASTWDLLDDYLVDKKPAATCIDSGGHHTQTVYKFCADRFKRRVYAIKGMAGTGKPVWPRKVSKPKRGAYLFVIGVDSAKDVVYSRLKLTTPGPGYCHFPSDRPDDWYVGLTCETVVTKYSKGFPVREYRRRPGIRNEPLDCRVYAYAALASFARVKWDALKSLRPKVEIPQETPVVAQIPAQRSFPRHRSNWVNNWRG